MAVDEQGGPRGEAGRHGEGFARVELDQDEALPAGTVAVAFGLEVAEKGLLELEDIDDAVGGDQGVLGGGKVGEQDVFIFVGAGRQEEARLLTSAGSSRSRTERCWTERTLS